MASASKTPNLNLPQWVGTEKPERSDFNTAFSDIDTAHAAHLADYGSHILNDTSAHGLASILTNLGNLNGRFTFLSGSSGPQEIQLPAFGMWLAVTSVGLNDDDAIGVYAIFTRQGNYARVVPILSSSFITASISPSTYVLTLGRQSGSYSVSLVRLGPSSV